jgi:hypothetical protein
MADNLLYYGDNLDILQRYVKDETVDLVYLDPPFKSNQDYNVLFAEQNDPSATQTAKIALTIRGFETRRGQGPIGIGQDDLGSRAVTAQGVMSLCSSLMPLLFPGRVLSFE